MPFPSSSEPSQALPLVDQPMPHQEPPTGEAAEHHSTSFRRYHFLPTFQPLLSHRGQCSARLEGELRKEVLLLMLSYFGNLVAFCLILNFFKFLFYSPWLLRKNFQNEMREIEFLSFHLT